MNVYTIGFTKKSAQAFFGLLEDSGARRVVDVRLNNVSQLAGFAKRDDLAYFLKEICDMDYVHLPQLAPTKDLLDAYKRGRIDWASYERSFLELMAERAVEDSVPQELIDGGCLLCSEDKAHHCHRRLVAEYLEQCWGSFDVRHLERWQPRMGDDAR